MNKELAKSIGSASRQARAALELTQEDAAERIEVSVEFYARIERGNSLPSVPTLARIAGVLGVSADALLGRIAFVPGASPGWQVSPPTDAPEIRRVIRMLRRASPGALRLVTMLLKEIERRTEGRPEGEGEGVESGAEGEGGEGGAADDQRGRTDEDGDDGDGPENE
ncbi:MAG TPA: helix-turn-helix transcriptional regulator [Haliangium sp.]|nr:helix-turn-helix transcriptional regulator [Haliangium sp.]